MIIKCNEKRKYSSTTTNDNLAHSTACAYPKYPPCNVCNHSCPHLPCMPQIQKSLHMLAPVQRFTLSTIWRLGINVGGPIDDVSGASRRHQRRGVVWPSTMTTSLGLAVIIDNVGGVPVVIDDVGCVCVCVAVVVVVDECGAGRRHR